MGAAQKIKGSVSAAPIGAAAGVVIGYLVAKKLGYEKTITIVSFSIVGIIIGSAIGSTVKERIV